VCRARGGGDSSKQVLPPGAEDAWGRGRGKELGEIIHLVSGSASGKKDSTKKKHHKGGVF